MAVAEHQALDGPAITISLWVSPRNIPGPGMRAGLVDNDGQYGLFVYENGMVRCTTAGRSVEANAVLQAFTWSSLTCTFDSNGMSLWHDGRQIDSSNVSGALSTAGNMGMSIARNTPSGDHLIGRIDNVRMWSRVLPAGEICRNAIGCAN